MAPQRGGRRRIRVSADILTSGSAGDTTADGDESSGESRLSDTDMMSPDDDPDLDALLSPDLDTPDEMEDSIMERECTSYLVLLLLLLLSALFIRRLEKCFLSFLLKWNYVLYINN